MVTSGCRTSIWITLMGSKIIRRSGQTMCILDYRRRFHWSLPIEESLLLAVGYLHGIPRTYRGHRTGIENTSMARRHYLRDKRQDRRPRTGIARNSHKPAKRRLPRQWKEDWIIQKGTDVTGDYITKKAWNLSKTKRKQSPNWKPLRTLKT